MTEERCCLDVRLYKKYGSVSVSVVHPRGELLKSDCWEVISVVTWILIMNLSITEYHIHTSGGIPQDNNEIPFTGCCGVCNPILGNRGQGQGQVEKLISILES